MTACRTVSMKIVMPLVLFSLRLNLPDFIIKKDHPLATI